MSGSFESDDYERTARYAASIRRIVGEYADGRLSAADYRAERRRLLEALVSGAAPEAATVPRRPGPRPAARAAPAPAAPGSGSELSAAKPTAGGRAPAVLPLTLAALVLAAALAGWLLLGQRAPQQVPVGAAPKTEGAADAVRSVPPAPTLSDAPAPRDAPVDPARRLVEEFLRSDDWSASAVDAFLRRWQQLPRDARLEAREARWFRPFEQAVSDRILAQRAYFELVPDAERSPADRALSALAAALSPASAAAAAGSPTAAVPSAVADGAADADADADSDAAAPRAAPAAQAPGDASAVGPPPGAAAPPSAGDAGPTAAMAAVKAAPGGAGGDVPAALGEADSAGTGMAAELPDGADADVADADVADVTDIPNAADADPSTPVAEAPEAAAAGPPSTCTRALLETRRRTCRDTLADGGAGPVLVVLPPGAFVMGSDDDPAASPAREVVIDYPFAMSRHETSLAEYLRYCSSTGARCPSPPWDTPDRPVVDVSWQEASAYAEWLSARTAGRYRLPSEAEWEYAARAGAASAFPFGDELLPSDAWYAGAGSPEAPMPQSSRSIRRNAFGLFHMIGNVREWVADGWRQGFDDAAPDGRPRPADGPLRVVRGGAWTDDAHAVRLSSRAALPADTRDTLTGFRVVRVLE